jgi:tRNA-dihydrouridine synthase
VVGSGDVRTVADIQRMKQHTNCDAVMIGRGAIANPWIFAGYDREQVPHGLLQETVREHLQKSIQFYGEEDGQRLFRKYAVQYLLLKTLDREARKENLEGTTLGGIFGDVESGVRGDGEFPVIRLTEKNSKNSVTLRQRFIPTPHPRSS